MFKIKMKWTTWFDKGHMKSYQVCNQNELKFAEDFTEIQI